MRKPIKNRIISVTAVFCFLFAFMMPSKIEAATYTGQETTMNLFGENDTFQKINKK